MSKYREIKLLAVLNRGEAAMRCIRSVKSLRIKEASEGLRTLALYTKPDRGAPFVRHADFAYELIDTDGPVAAYLNHDAVLQVLQNAGADALWPGWGFCSEHPEFAEKLERADIRFLGPPASAMRRVGDKIAAKELAESVAVPVIPWSGKAVNDESDAVQAARRIGFPIMVKATAGGGGRGIRKVLAENNLSESLLSARTEAKAAFGDGRLFLESIVSSGRHVEVQIMADNHGHIYSLGCRDCSVQRRYQKVIEEAPPAGLSKNIIDNLQRDAINMAVEVGYAGVGTVEFLVDGDQYYFLEMNPRLQVEHGITEAVTGLDLVELQIRIARGESLDSLEIKERGVAIEARMCAEDPASGFLPKPGRIVRFDPTLGPHMRLDTGVAVNTTVPEVFDSLIAKVISTGDTREEARARLICSLADFDLVVEGGATNKGYLIDLLSHPDYIVGGVDIGWLDRLGNFSNDDNNYEAEALITAAILAYQRTRALARRNFFLDTTDISLSRVPPSAGQEIDLSCQGESYHVEVYAVGSWRYRVHLDERAVTVTLREEGEHGARLEVGDKALPILYDTTDSGLRVEISGRAHQFGWKTLGQVRAGTPGMIVAVHVREGDSVTIGQPLGILEAMKMEVSFDAPVAGIISDVSVRAGQQIAAGDILLTIDPTSEHTSDVESRRILLPELHDSLFPDYFSNADAIDANGSPSFSPSIISGANEDFVESIAEEVRRVLLGFDINALRVESLVSFLEMPLDQELSNSHLSNLGAIRYEIGVAADVFQLFVRSSRASVSGELGPSNNARMKMFVRRLRADGSGIAEEFLELIQKALKHYGVDGLDYSDALERAVLRLLASQVDPDLRQRVLLSVLRRTVAVSRIDRSLRSDQVLAENLSRLIDMRALVTDQVADAAIDARYEIFDKPSFDEQIEKTSRQVDSWLQEVKSELTPPPLEVVRELSDKPRPIFNLIGSWISHKDPKRQAIGLNAHLQRLYSPLAMRSHVIEGDLSGSMERAVFEDDRIVLAAVCSSDDIVQVIDRLHKAASDYKVKDDSEISAWELFLTTSQHSQCSFSKEDIIEVLRDKLSAQRFTLNFVGSEGIDRHLTFVADSLGIQERIDLHDIHPESAHRINLDRLENFKLERVSSPEDVYCFNASSRAVQGDERIFVLADVRSRSPEPDRKGEIHRAAFEKAFYESTRVLRNYLSVRDPKQILQWNRVVIYCGLPFMLDPELTMDLARRLWPETRQLGLEKVVVRVGLLSPDNPKAEPEPTEFVITDITGSRMEIERRDPRSNVLEPVSDYERKVLEARRRRLVYPYEIIRMLTGGREDLNPDLERLELPLGEFEEFDVSAGSSDFKAESVEGRPFGQNRSGIVFGLIRAYTEKHPEGMRRVLILSDPTREMGALSSEECDRIIAALNLAEERGVPVEWIPVSAGAKIAMDSGTENLDATARVVRRIVEFTQNNGVIHLIIQGVNVGAQSYWNALATMLMHTRGILIMTPNASMVLTGRAALEASGGVSAEDEIAIGGFERIMGPNGEAQYYASDLAEAYRILYEHYRYTYISPGESRPRLHNTTDEDMRTLRDYRCEGSTDSEFTFVGEIFEDETNPGRKKPFPMRPVMGGLIDQDGGYLERWSNWVGAETAIVWDAHLGGIPITLIGIESQNIPREGYRPLDGPSSWNGGTLFPLSSKKIARALNAASGNRPAVILANLSGFDGSPESMRKLQLECGAEIARAVVNFSGPILFLVVSRYHGGAYVVFSNDLNTDLYSAALSGSYASVIGGGPAAKVVFSREVKERTMADANIRMLQERLRLQENPEVRASLEKSIKEVTVEKQSEVAEEFDEVHTVERALAVGSLQSIVEPDAIRVSLIGALRKFFEGNRT